jgi:hypothetical protein
MVIVYTFLPSEYPTGWSNLVFLRAAWPIGSGSTSIYRSIQSTSFASVQSDANLLPLILSVARLNRAGESPSRSVGSCFLARVMINPEGRRRSSPRSGTLVKSSLAIQAGYLQRQAKYTVPRVRWSELQAPAARWARRRSASLRIRLRRRMASGVTSTSSSSSMNSRAISSVRGGNGTGLILTGSCLALTGVHVAHGPSCSRRHGVSRPEPGRGADGAVRLGRRRVSHGLYPRARRSRRCRPGRWYCGRCGCSRTAACPITGPGVPGVLWQRQDGELGAFWLEALLPKSWR